MSSPSEPSLTAAREELKYRLEHAHVAGLVRCLLSHLAPHRFRGEGENRLPDAHHYSTTVYLDTPSRSLFEAGRRSVGQNLKIRAREYYDLHSSLAELATDPSQIVRQQPWIWLELKRRDGNQSFKHRARIKKRDVPGFFRGECVPAPSTPEEQADLAVIRATLAELGDPLQASVLVNYRRLAFQDERARLRVTLDLELAFYAVPPDIWSAGRALVRGTFGPPKRIERQAVLEIKHHDPLPAWLERALEDARAEPELAGKFLRAGQAVHGGV